ncbi:sterol desaturase family protein [Vibrio sp.]|uniref:sterol desaturase family protein n=1 Tax=Vibrio sp. TaxID=678 RepID=UPI003D1226DF
MPAAEMIRFSVFVLVFTLCAVWEWRRPRKPLSQSKATRWLNNIGLVGLNSVCLALIMPMLAMDAAFNAEHNQLGLFNTLSLPSWLEILLAVVLLDFAIYLQHVLFHRLPWLWRLHRVHHADQDIDVTTGARFHPIEIILSMWIKIGLVVALGISPIAVLIFEVLLNACAMFNHSNAFLPLKADKLLRKIIVTPDMHRVHHSVIRAETDSNFGFCLSIWDRWLGTYRAQPKYGHQGVKIGINLFRRPREQWLDKLLTQPFRSQ